LRDGRTNGQSFYMSYGRKNFPSDDFDKKNINKGRLKMITSESIFELLEEKYNYVLGHKIHCKCHRILNMHAFMRTVQIKI